MATLARWIAWLLFGALAFATLAPIEFRPIVADSANLERAAAYALLGFLFTLGYPRHRLAALLAILLAAGLLEFGQTLTESRHGRVPDFAVKAGAAAFGAFAAAFVPMLLSGFRRQGAPPG